MKNQQAVPAPSKLNLRRPIYNFIPEFLVAKIARETGAQAKARTFRPWSHGVALLSAQLTHSLGLNDVGDALRLHAGPLASLRGATPPSRNNLSPADKVRPAQLAEDLFWAGFQHLRERSPRLVSGQAGKRFARRFKRTIRLVTSTTIPLLAACLDWAKHRRRKAAAKCHRRLDRQSFRPRCALVDTARHAAAQRARAVCAAIQAGEIVIFDRAYVDFSQLADLALREVFWVTRAKENLKFQGFVRYQRGAVGKILRADLIKLQTAAAGGNYPVERRRVVALVEVAGKEVEREFRTNNWAWSAQRIAQLYRCRWQSEVFFKQLKQALQWADFLGPSANAVRWQIWTALLVDLRLR